MTNPEYPRPQPADTDQPERPSPHNDDPGGTATTAAEQAFDVFVQLPGVDPDSDEADLRELFDQCYVGAYHDEYTMIRDLTGIDQLQTVIRELRDSGLPVDRFLTVDYTVLPRLLRERWSFVHHGEHIYVFEL